MENRLKRVIWRIFPDLLKRSWLFPAVLFILVLLTACLPVTANVKINSADSQGELGSIQKSGTLVIATDPDYAPQSQLLKDQPRAQNTICDLTQYTANQWTGFDIEVAKEVASRMGVEPCFVAPAWSQIVAGNWGDRWNINVGSMVITPERMEKLYFTQPYVSGAAVLFVHKDNHIYQKPADLSGKRIGVCTGCAYESYLDGTLQIPGEKIDLVIHDANVVGYDTDTSALADLAVGDGTRLDAVLTDPDTGSTAIQNGLAIKQLGQPVYFDYDAIAIDKNSSSDPLPLVRRLTEIIQEMHKDGTLLKLSQKYYGGDFTSPAAAFDLHSLGQIP
jgi:polar amino acid transport system substrate-binding protein